MSSTKREVLVKNTVMDVHPDMDTARIRPRGSPREGSKWTLAAAEATVHKCCVVVLIVLAVGLVTKDVSADDSVSSHASRVVRVCRSVYRRDANFAGRCHADIAISGVRRTARRLAMTRPSLARHTSVRPAFYWNPSRRRRGVRSHDREAWSTVEQPTTMATRRCRTASAPVPIWRDPSLITGSDR